MNHPLEVAITLITKFGVRNADAIMAALLHDSVEDQPHRLISVLGAKVANEAQVQSQALRLLGEHFTPRVAEMVGHLTNPDFKAMVTQAQLEGDRRSEDELKIHFYKEHFLEILKKDPETFLIKLSDFSKNAFGLGKLADGPKKAGLRAKYGAVILSCSEALRDLPASGHLLSSIKDSLIEELSQVYKRDYIPSVG